MSDLGTLDPTTAVPVVAPAMSNASALSGAQKAAIVLLKLGSDRSAACRATGAALPVATTVERTCSALRGRPHRA